MVVVTLVMRSGRSGQTTAEVGRTCLCQCAVVGGVEMWVLVVALSLDEVGFFFPQLLLNWLREGLFVQSAKMTVEVG